jgi:sugar phosphate isomerase/epimerase
VPAHPPGRGRAQVDARRAGWRDLEALAAEAGVRFVAEIHDRSLANSASAALRLIDGCDPRRVGVVYDVANSLAEGNEPLPQALDLLGPYLAHVHVKDVAVKATGDGWTSFATGFVPLGAGALRWGAILRCLRETGYAGWLSIENFTGLDQGPGRLAGDLAWLRARLGESHA